MQDAEGRLRAERRDGRLVDRTRAERAAEDEHDRVAGVQAEPRARRRAIGRRRRARGGRSAGSARRRGPRAGRPGRRGARTGRASGSPARDGCRPRSGPAGSGAARRRARRVRRRSPPPPMTAAGRSSPRIRHAATTAPSDLSGRAQRLQRIRPAEPLDGDRAQLVAGTRDELALGPLAADEHHARRGAGASPQRVGHRQGRNDVPRRSPGCDDVGRRAHRLVIVPYRGRR